MKHYISPIMYIVVFLIRTKDSKNMNMNMLRFGDRITHICRKFEMYTEFSPRKAAATLEWPGIAMRLDCSRGYIILYSSS